ncbi:conserved hypothetical protein [Chthoniobacter flavus Ellin428]|uniref:DUF4112 domain-containing protein n=1 Tax=Chthoniobacter flavus Ellin428 TaxID=497964 RepID=B4CU51_9BACT|nr:DUF4112 domain-containing protein [Chthoniobacter flavus]EDY22089.1 conserved hypothetical protein [Chthoniobacter flavus Ellin428]
MKTQEVEFEVLGKEAPQSGHGSTVDPFIALMARLMDDIFVIPGTSIRFGLDPIISLLPAFGATASAGVSLVLIALSARRGVPKIVLARMATNVVINAALDSVPVVGDALSIFFRSNARNYELLQKHAGQSRASTAGDWLFLLGLFGIVIAVIALMIIGSIAVLHFLLTPFRR